MVRILYFQSHPVFGATENYLAQLAEGVVRLGHEVHLLHPDHPDAIAGFGHLPADVVVLHRTQTQQTNASVVSLVRYWSGEIRRLHPEIVHVNDPSITGVLAARLAGVRNIVVTHHTPELKRRYNTLGRLLEWLAFRFTRRVIFTSPQSLEAGTQSDRIPLARAHAIPYGLDSKWLVPVSSVQRVRCRTALGVTGDELLIVNPARLARQKRQDLLIQAARRVVDKFPQCRFAIAGEGELRTEIEQLIHEYQLVDHFRLLGHRQDIVDVITSADIVVMTSDFEGLCYAVIEAAAREVAVVATAVGGMRYSVSDGVTGKLVPAGSVDEIAAALVELVENPQLRRSFGINGRQRAVELFSLERMITDTDAVYQELLSEDR
ncbi:MAG: glycosyltransferase [Chloroflexi bacterium]|nr:glycosyltransferase [Chloroflexota bacterium]